MTTYEDVEKAIKDCQLSSGNQSDSRCFVERRAWRTYAMFLEDHQGLPTLIEKTKALVKENLS